MPSVYLEEAFACAFGSLLIVVIGGWVINRLWNTRKKEEPHGS
jgi:hypothetical protein